MLSNVTRALSISILAAFIGASLFGMSHPIGMQATRDGKMGGCMFTGTSLCTMTPLEHASAWQNTFTSLPAEVSQALLLVFLLSLIFSLTTIVRLLPIFKASEIDSAGRLYAKRFLTHPYFNPLQEAFSRGILNPKAY